MEKINGGFAPSEEGGDFVFHGNGSRVKLVASITNCYLRVGAIVPREVRALPIINYCHCHAWLADGGGGAAGGDATMHRARRLPLLLMRI